jgi:hypothetical protein
MLNEAMKIERSRALEADPYKRSQSRQGYASRFKARTAETRLGPPSPQAPQTRGVESYPSVLTLSLGEERP